MSPVTLGEADAGIVYTTDVKAAGDKPEGVDIPDDLNVSAEYPIGLAVEAAGVGLSRTQLAAIAPEVSAGFELGFDAATAVLSEALEYLP